MNIKKLLRETNGQLARLRKIAQQLREEFGIVGEGDGAQNIFSELSKILHGINMMPNSIINASKFQEHEIVDALRKIGFEYKKPMGKMLHFFNKKTSVSVYLAQQTRYLSLTP